jgi:hypothetical protein
LDGLVRAVFAGRGLQLLEVAVTSERGEEARRRSLRWARLGWEGATTAAQEERRKEEVLEIFRLLVEDSKRLPQAREFVAHWESSPW